METINYYLPIDFEYDSKPLLEIAKKYLDSAIDGFKNSDGGYTTYEEVGKVEEGKYSVTSLYLRDIKEDFSNLKILKDCSKLLNKDFDHVFKYAQFFKVNGSLPPHIDKRTAAFTIPLYGVNKPVSWYDDNNQIIQQYTYKGPSIINTSIKHGCIENDEERVFFQIGGFSEPFDQIIKNVKNNLQLS